ncbi:MAG: hypothetical protein COV07_00570 [Candidatus Vogelbacteria bacterium CG10_big_fil_rev_8_21_14_0_10_45_14]|uniref:Exonuclease domain-containing protein n=1 Tax=Candidatus Vogelbacteria bacterium CG10_big_fil_rev_8_21_14_0_10_45_14 TaxID=1975042 RepID=A0A2H0RKS9_9BACT|nr:MAG: hypothetical protein COV07_00570 [Candidatus Vogelbacteria bacterium CG10_big_fil_rev_8_21_14_0_10_45_14]
MTHSGKPAQEVNMRDSNLAFIDLETTGLDPTRHEIIEIGLVLVKQKRTKKRGYELLALKEWDVKVKPMRIQDADKIALKINGYREEDWKSAINLKRALEKLSKLTKGAIIVAQNIAFDWAFLEKAYREYGVPMGMHSKRKLDTVSIWFAKYHNDPVPEKFSLYHMAKYTGVKNIKAHTALSDARATFEIYKKVMCQNNPEQHYNTHF